MGTRRELLGATAAIAIGAPITYKLLHLAAPDAMRDVDALAYGAWQGKVVEPLHDLGAGLTEAEQLMGIAAHDRWVAFLGELPILGGVTLSVLLATLLFRNYINRRHDKLDSERHRSNSGTGSGLTDTDQSDLQHMWF